MILGGDGPHADGLEHFAAESGDANAVECYSVLTSWISWVIDALASPKSITVLGL